MAINNWDRSVVYTKNDVVSRNSILYFCLIDNYGKDPALYNEFQSANSIWSSASFFPWRPSYDSSINNNVNNRRYDSSEGLTNIEDYKINKNIDMLNLTFDKLSDSAAFAILTFLENTKGIERFDFYPTNPYNKNKYICKNWKHSWVFAQNNTIAAIFERKF